MDISIVASGLQAMSGKMSAHAHNIANANTPGYRSLVARTIERPEGGVDLSITRDPASDPGSVQGDGQIVGSSEGEPTSTGPIAYGPARPPAPSNVDLASEQVGMMTAATTFEALVAAYGRQQQALGTLFDAFG